MEKSYAIQVKDVTKIYKLYDKPLDRLKESLGFTKEKKYKEHFALKNVSMDILRGETVGIIGTNGSGKSTILKIITGVLNPTGGEVIVDGRISALLELGAGFNMEYTGIENVFLNGTMIGFSEEEIQKRLPDILEFADIGEFANQPVKTYSSGMFVRLAFAVAINIEPEILIVDEALSVGDVFFQAKCYHKFEEFKEAGKTIVFVSHDLSSIAKYCDRVYLLNKGEILGEGKPKKMLDIYKQVLVGQYKPAKDSTMAEALDNLGEDRAGLLQNAEIQAASKGPQKDKPDNAKEKDILEGEKESLYEEIKEGVNPELIEYGTKKARIDKFYVIDNHSNVTTSILKGTEFSIIMEVDIQEDLPAPIFAVSFKNVHGTEITGTNTMFEKAFLEPVKKGERKKFIFTQEMNLQGGEYLLSMGVTGYEGDNFVVYHRLYDVLNITVVSDKNTVGYYDMNTKITVQNMG